MKDKGGPAEGGVKFLWCGSPSISQNPYFGQWLVIYVKIYFRSYEHPCLILGSRGSYTLALHSCRLCNNKINGAGELQTHPPNLDIALCCPVSVRLGKRLLNLLQ